MWVDLCGSMPIRTMVLWFFVGWEIRSRQVDFKDLSQHLVVTPLLSSRERRLGGLDPGESAHLGDRRLASQSSQPSPVRFGPLGRPRCWCLPYK